MENSLGKRPSAESAEEGGSSSKVTRMVEGDGHGDIECEEQVIPQPTYLPSIDPLCKGLILAILKAASDDEIAARIALVNSLHSRGISKTGEIIDIIKATGESRNLLIEGALNRLQAAQQRQIDSIEKAKRERARRA